MSIRSTAFMIGTMLFAAVATAADPKSSDSDTRDPSVREAQAARQEAKRGGLTDVGPAQSEQNRFARCEGLPADERGYCIRRMSGEGTVSGSVEGGGIYRELRVPVPAQ